MREKVKITFLARVKYTFSVHILEVPRPNY